jgi:hypothetical protein
VSEPRYRISMLIPYRKSDRRVCAAGTRCPSEAHFVASSPSFAAKPMCEKHAGQFAKRHGIEVPA